jgi:hypothetical protein
VIASKLPRRFALVGVLIGFSWMGLYWFDYKYNPFHLPPPPSLYNLLEKAMFVLCPGLVLQIFTIGTSDRLGWAMWVLAAFLNGPLYYLLGLLFVAIMKGGSRAPASVK